MYIARLLCIKTEIRKVHNPFYNRIPHLLCSIIYFVRSRAKKLSTGGGCWGNGGTVLISSWKCNFSIYLDIQAITTLLCHLLVHYVLVPSIPSTFYVTTALLKSDVFRHLKAIFSPSFGPTEMALGSC